MGRAKIAELAKETSIYTKESPERISKSGSSVLIGIPKESAAQEKRVVLTPEAVALLVSNGQRVLVESKAGELSKFSDREYSDAGAQVVYSSKEAFDVEVVLKVEPPKEEEINEMRQGACLISALQLG